MLLKDKNKLNISNDNLNNSNNTEKKIKRYKKKSLVDNNGILLTDNTYIMKHCERINASIKKEQLNDITCLKNEKQRIEKNLENNEQFLKNVLKSEIIKENNIRKVQEKINKKEEKINEFINDRKESIKYLENERYKDLKDKDERSKIYNKMMKNFGQQLNMTNINNKNINSINKNEELKEQISNYEKRNAQYKKKISQIFDINSSNKIKLYLPKGYENKSSDGRQKKMMEIEDKYEMNIIKRENVFLNRLNIMQNKINDYMEKKEKKDNRIKQSIEKRDKLREEKKILNDIRMDEIKEKLENTKFKLEKTRLKKLENLEQKQLKNYAIKKEKIKLYEEMKKIIQKTTEEKNAAKLKLQKIIRRQNNSDKIQDNDKFINNILYNNN